MGMMIASVVCVVLALSVSVFGVFAMIGGNYVKYAEERSREEFHSARN